MFQMIHGNKTLNDDVEKNRQKILYKNLKIEKGNFDALVAF